MTVEFLGELDSSFLTYKELSDHFDVTEGTLNTTIQADRWLQFILDGKELIASKVTVRNAISYNYLYSKGLVYGTDDIGIMVPIDEYDEGPVNQLKTIVIDNKLYKCRLLKGSDTDPCPDATAGYDLPGTQQSEWSRLFYPIVIDDTNIISYTGPKLAAYTKTDLGMWYAGLIMPPGSYSWCQEATMFSSPSNPLGTHRVVRGSSGPSHFTRPASATVGAHCGWRVLLELI